MEIPEPIQKQMEKKGGLKAIVKRLPDRDRMTEQSKIYHALSEPLRLEILNLLSIQPLCVCLIKEVTKTPDSKLSYHLSILKDSGLIEGKQKGNWIIYNVTRLGRKYCI